MFDIRCSNHELRTTNHERGACMDNNSSEKNVPVSKNYQKNVDYLNRELGVPENFDIVLREMTIGGKRVAIYSVNGMVDTHVASYILDALIDLERPT